MKRLFLLITLCLSLVSNNVIAAGPLQLVTAGPGNRIHGVDISKWQHPYDKPINFAKMAKAGVRFVIIKGSDSQAPADALAKKYLIADRTAAQAAGLYTGFYYFSYLPDTTKKAEIIADAKAQAQKTIWRLGEIGGYTEQDLPVALDLETNCVRIISGVCKKYASRANVSLWAKTWLAEVEAKTNRKPFVYSYPSFLQNAMTRSTELAKYPLWIAAYGKQPAEPANHPGMKSVGCFAHSWTKADCRADYQIWQYTSCGKGSKYGVASSRIDLNVFSGSEDKFYALTKGVWQPEAVDLLPFNEPTTATLISSVTSITTNDSADFVVDAVRPNGTPVVTGSVRFISADSLVKVGVQDVIRSASGRWTLKISALTAGTYVGFIEYFDESQTHASSVMPVMFEVTQGPTPTPKPSPTKKPAPKPVDACAGQIRN
ncbi:MAG: GH25 family lysozyme [Actinobacteria bacterium]|nr:GH25 family lysozyme [Actinomycetota bacterium]